MKSKIIVLEGLSGSGKTTIGKFIANEMNGYFLPTPENHFKSLRSYADIASPESRFLFYLTSVSFASEKIKELSKQYSLIIVDRFIASTISYHAAAGVNHDVLEIYKKLDLIKPDKTILLISNSKLREQRMLERGEFTVSDKWELEMNFDQEVTKNLISFSDIVIKNESTLDDCIRKILSEI